ncbi:MAG: PGPGW domain-containing protein [Gammaproteobacteria bacterium]|nr:PGPGW domain-containing protein [Gammaproteobacteria bacterium]MDH3769024.1 PGPGW domain-containing protein [Gammaproteobacteria bacterium]
MIRRAGQMTYRMARRIVIGVIGGSLLLLGLALIVLPGPAFIVIPVGLVILSLEFAWARSWLLAIRRGISRRQQSAHR